MAAVASAGAVAATAVQWSPTAVSSSSSAVSASRSVAFRGTAVAVKPLRVCRRGNDGQGLEFLQSRMQRLAVKASAEDGELELTKPAGSNKKVKIHLTAKFLLFWYVLDSGHWVSLTVRPVHQWPFSNIIFKGKENVHII
jgi:hypothetical protein